MRELLGIAGDYDDRCMQLKERQLALWDVLKNSERPGSLDSAINMDSAQANDFGTFFETHTAIERVVFNGRKAEQMFGRFANSAKMPKPVVQIGAPSTSPAYAAMPYSGKLSAWRHALMPLIEQK